MDGQFDQGPGSGYGEGAGSAARMAKDTIKDNVTDVKEKITDFGRKAVDQIDSQREPLANTLQKTASALHQQGESAATVAHATAGKLESTADYVRQHDLKAMMGDVQELAKQYPGQCLAAAVALGFLLGRVLRKSD